MYYDHYATSAAKLSLWAKVTVFCMFSLCLSNSIIKFHWQRYEEKKIAFFMESKCLQNQDCYVGIASSFFYYFHLHEQPSHSSAFLGTKSQKGSTEAMPIHNDR